MGLFERVSKFALLSAVLTAVGFLIHLIGYGAPYWIKSGDYNIGLWKYCYDGECFDKDSEISKYFFERYEGWLTSVKIVETFAFSANLVTIIVMGLRFTVQKERKILPIYIFIFQFASVGLILLGVIIYGVKSPLNSYGFAFVFEIISANMILVAGIYSVLDWRRTSLPVVEQ